MLNKVVLIGRLTKDPELKYTPSNVAVTSFTLAVDRRFARQGEERATDFINIVAWRNTAEFVAKYFTKGRPMAVMPKYISASGRTFSVAPHTFSKGVLKNNTKTILEKVV